MPTDYSLALIAAVNDREILCRNLLNSAIAHRPAREICLISDVVSASTAYNRGISSTTADILVFAHQDVYFPPSWEDHLRCAIARTESLDPDWAVIGIFGVTEDEHHCGQVWSSGLGGCVGEVVASPKTVQSVDELVIVLRRAAGIRFDDSLPHFHLYGTDIVQIAKRQGLASYVCCLPVVHNSRFVESLAGSFTEAYRYMQRKWCNSLPIKTPVVRVSRYGSSLLAKRFRLWNSKNRRRAQSVPHTSDPVKIAECCGWIEEGRSDAMSGNLAKDHPLNKSQRSLN